MKDIACIDCVYYLPYVNGNGQLIYGECRFNPPTSQRVQSMRDRDMFPAIFEWVTNWPRVEREDYCGQFKEMGTKEEA